MTSTLGAIYLDLTSVLLGTGYDRFSSPTGIQGLAKQDGSRLDLLAIDASDPGKGQFREFMRQAKSEFEQIFIWEVWNPLLKEILVRYGFRPAVGFFEGEMLTGFWWRAGWLGGPVKTPIQTHPE